MKLFKDKDSKSFKQQVRIVTYILLAIIIIIFNFMFLEYMSIEGLTPDLLIILCVWIALKEGQFVALFAGFGIGLLFDILSPGIIGISALTKTFVGFVAGFFFKENAANQIIGSYRFLLIVLFCSILHNLIYFLIYIKPSEISLFTFFLKYGLAISLYTTIFALFPMFLKLPKKIR